VGKSSKPGIAEVKEINNFLKAVKKEIREGRFFLIPRKKNLESAGELGVFPDEEILTLSYKDYDRGPLPDKIFDGYVWEFIKKIDNNNTYIKLKVDERGCICLSFHKSDGPTSLPYREK